MKKITVLGGGTGTFVVLSGLKNLPLDLAVIVSMMDSGGSTGRLRDQLGVLPPGDLRQCLVALSDAPALWRKLFLYRFESGDLAGHNFGNIFISALEKVSENYDQVIETASFVLKTKGKVMPVTFKNTNICVEYESGKIVKGEGNIDKNYQEKTRVKKAYLVPQVTPNPKAIERLLKSDIIIIGPGDFYSSLIPILLVKDVKMTIKKSKAKIIYILNLTTKSGQTPNYKASDHLKDISFYLSRPPDVVIVNNGPVLSSVIKWYQSHGEKLVENDINKTNLKSKVVKKDIVDTQIFRKTKADRFVNLLVRSILRHDSNKLAKIILKLI